MAQIWFLCLLQVKLVKNGTISQGTMKYTKKLSLKKSHEELYQILISNTMTSIYVHCTVSDLPPSLGERNRAGVCGLAWTFVESCWIPHLMQENMAGVGLTSGP